MKYVPSPTPQFVLVAMHYDHSGIIQTFGPYGSEDEANQAEASLKSWPLISGAEWRVCPLTDTRPFMAPSPVAPANLTGQ